MDIACCYRLIPNGEVIHTVYNRESDTIVGLPTEWYQTPLLELPEYSIRSYDNCTAKFDQMCETVLLSNDQFALVVENNNIGYYILQFDGVKRFLRSATDGRDSSSDNYIPAQELFRSIGFRRTKQRQIRSSAGVYRLTLGKNNGLVYTNDGILTPSFDINSLGKVDYHYRGYKEMIALNHYAVVYIDDAPVFLDKTEDNKLIIAS